MMSHGQRSFAVSENTGQNTWIQYVTADQGLDCCPCIDWIKYGKELRPNIKGK